ncbi:MAG: hypothetical protein WAP24_07975 [Thermacetogeniaceae bacterium]
MTDLILETRYLKKYYGKQLAVNNISLQIPRGSMESGGACVTFQHKVFLNIY